MRLACSRYTKYKATKNNIFKKKLQAIGGKSTLPRSKKGEKRLKSAHELNSALKDVMRSTAAGEETKDVSRSAVPLNRKGEDGALRKGDGDGAVQRNSSKGGDEQDREEDAVAKESINEEEDLVVKDYVPPKKKKQVSMYSFFNK